MAEKENWRNEPLKGVRTYFYHAHHWRGLPELAISDDLPYDDHAWVPKRKMNEFLTKEYYDIFIDSCLTR